MKKLSLLLGCLLTLSHAKADFGPCCCFEVEIITTNSKYHGFIRILEGNFKNDSLENSKYFTKASLNAFQPYITQVKLHNYIIPVSFGDDQTISYMSRDLIDSIDFKDISKIIYKSTCNCYVGTDIVTRLTKNDLQWATKKPLRIDEFSYDVCGIAVQYYEDSHELNQLIKELKETTKDINNDRPFRDKINELQGFKVIIIESCSI